MFTFRRFLSCALLLPLAVLAGCESVFNVQPQEFRGGFTVLVDVPGQPGAARVVADIDDFATHRGFVRQSAGPPPPTAPERFLLGKIVLDVTYDAAHLRVNASLHSFSHQLGRKFIEGFYRDFHQQYAARYGDEGAIVENDDTNDTGNPPRGGGHGGGGGSRGGH